MKWIKVIWKILLFLGRPSLVGMYGALYGLYLDNWLAAMFFLGVSLVCQSVERHADNQNPPAITVNYHDSLGQPSQGNNEYGPRV